MNILLLKDAYHDAAKGLYIPKGTVVQLVTKYGTIYHVRWEGYNYLVELKHSDYKEVE